MASCPPTNCCKMQRRLVLVCWPLPIMTRLQACKACNRGESGSCRLIHGIELSTTWRKIGIHVVGLNIDMNNPILLAGIARQQEARHARAGIIAERLEKLGYTGVYDGAAKLAGAGGIARPHFAQYLKTPARSNRLPKLFASILGPVNPAMLKNRGLVSMKSSNGFTQPKAAQCWHIRPNIN